MYGLVASCFVNGGERGREPELNHRTMAKSNPLRVPESLCEDIITVRWTSSRFQRSMLCALQPARLRHRLALPALLAYREGAFGFPSTDANLAEQLAR
jgi:hypothetical protein